MTTDNDHLIDDFFRPDFDVDDIDWGLIHRNATGERTVVADAIQKGVLYFTRSLDQSLPPAAQGEAFVVTDRSASLAGHAKVPAPPVLYVVAARRLGRIVTLGEGRKDQRSFTQAVRKVADVVTGMLDLGHSCDGPSWTEPRAPHPVRRLVDKIDLPRPTPASTDRALNDPSTTDMALGDGRATSKPTVEAAQRVTMDPAGPVLFSKYGGSKMTVAGEDVLATNNKETTMKIVVDQCDVPCKATATWSYIRWFKESIDTE